MGQCGRPVPDCYCSFHTIGKFFQQNWIKLKKVGRQGHLFHCDGTLEIPVFKSIVMNTAENDYQNT